jgi:8-oxo-dGTP diphosphatase
MSKEDCFHLGVKGLLQNHEGKLLLLQLRPKHIETEIKDYWDIPGGRIQKNESLESALKREVYEETGLQNITVIRPFLMALSSIRIPIQNGGDVGLIFATYLCEVLGNTSIHLSNEHTHFEWFEPSRAADMLARNFPLELTEKIATLNVKQVLDFRNSFAASLLKDCIDQERKLPEVHREVIDDLLLK